MMKRTRHTPEQVIRNLRDADRMLSEQKSIAQAGSAILEIDTPAAAGIRAGDAKVTAIRVGSLSNTAVAG